MSQLMTPWRTVLLLAGLIFIGGCNTAPQSSPPSTSAPVITSKPAPSSDARTSEGPAAKEPTTVQEWNDQAFQFIEHARWIEAVDAAKKALALDSKNPAAWFNLGRAYLGNGQKDEALTALKKASELTGGTNRDVEFFRGQAAEGTPLKAAVIYQQALAKLPGDKEIAAALANLRARFHDLTPKTVQVDVDGDGLQDQVVVDLLKVTITTAAGKVLYDQQPWSFVPSWGGVEVQPMPLPEGPPVLDVTIGGCPAYYQHQILWYNHGTAAIQEVPVDAPCALLDTRGDGHFTVNFRSYPFSVGYRLRWMGGRFEREGPEEFGLMSGDLLTTSTIEEVLRVMLGGHFRGGDALFAKPELYQEFMQKIQSGKWTVGRVADQTASRVRIPLFGDGTIQGYVLFEPAMHLITGLEWLP